MAATKSYYENYFKNNAQWWVDGAYRMEGYSYPVGSNRLRILNKIAKKYDLKGKQCLDIGCGGGDISFFLAEQGAVVTGIDMTEKMLQIANRRKETLDLEEKKRIRFLKEDVYSLSDEVKDRKYDFIVAFGLIGYLASDRMLFEIVDEFCDSGTVFVLSCRNELFNLTSISDNTVREIKDGNAVNIIGEIDKYYEKEIPIKKSQDFVGALKDIINHLEIEDEKFIEEDLYKEGTGDSQPRQSTPAGIVALAKEYGFDLVQKYGVHPHLLLPRVNKKLPPQVFNKISDALCVFEEEDIAMVWSSVFITELLKKDC